MDIFGGWNSRIRLYTGVTLESFNSTKSQTVREKIHDCDALHLNDLSFNLLKTKRIVYIFRHSKVLRNVKRPLLRIVAVWKTRGLFVKYSFRLNFWLLQGRFQPMEWHLFGDFLTRFIVTIEPIWDRKYRAWTYSVVEILGLDSILTIYLLTF
jgi:hypothetical protein